MTPPLPFVKMRYASGDTASGDLSLDTYTYVHMYVYSWKAFSTMVAKPMHLLFPCVVYMIFTATAQHADRVTRGVSQTCRECHSYICIYIQRKTGSQKLAPGRVPCDSTGRSLDTILQDNQATDMCHMCDVYCIYSYLSHGGLGMK